METKTQPPKLTGDTAPVKIKPGAVKLNTEFTTLISPEKWRDQLRPESVKEVPHSEILDQLIEQFEPLNYEALAFPKVIELRERLNELNAASEQTDEIFRETENILKQLGKIKLNRVHYIIYLIENVMKVTRGKGWDFRTNCDLIYLYNGAFWATVEQDKIKLFLGNAAKKTAIPDVHSRYFEFWELLLKQLIATAYIEPPKVSNNTVLINLKNGTFSISGTGNVLLPFRSTDFMTYQLPFEYNPKTTAPIFTAHLNRVLPDEEYQNLLSEYLGYVFLKHNSGILRLEKALLLHGGGANGKSVIADTITALMGSDNISSYSLQSLTEEKGFYRAKIQYKLLNYCSDISTKVESACFKKMTSGDPLEACLKYGQPFIMIDYAKLIFNCNELPKTTDHSDAFYRRIKIIPFNVTIPKEEQDNNLASKIIGSELSGVFNWILQGLERLLQQGCFSDCQAADDVLEEYRLSGDSVGLFIDEHQYIKSTTRTIYTAELFGEYKGYCNDSNRKSLNKTNFNTRLKALGIQIDRESGTGQYIVNMEKRVCPDNGISPL